MAYATATLSANAGIALHFGGLNIWIDALHNEKVPSFSLVDPALLQRVWDSPDFAAPDVIFYTHCHPDHFSAELTRQAVERFGGAQLILPEPHFSDQLLLQGDAMERRIGNVTFEFYRLCHEDEKYVNVPHYGLILSDGTHTLLFPGDCALCNPALLRAIGERTVDAAFLDFPWVTLPRGRDFLREKLPAGTLVIDHLPFPADDPYDYRRVAHRASHWLPDRDIRFLEDPLQTITL